MKKTILQKKNVIVEEELDCIDMDDIGEFTRNINQKKKSNVFTVAYRCPLSDKCYRREHLVCNHVEYLL